MAHDGIFLSLFMLRAYSYSYERKKGNAATDISLLNAFPCFVLYLFVFLFHFLFSDKYMNNFPIAKKENLFEMHEHFFRICEQFTKHGFFLEFKKIQNLKHFKK